MSRPPSTRNALSAVVLMPLTAVLAASIPLVASCASNEEVSSGTDDASVLVADGGSDASPSTDAGDGAVDCDAGGNSRCTAQALTCDQADWCPTGTPVAGHLLLGVWGSGPNDVWAVGTAGTILHWDGATWVATPNGDAKQTYNVVWGSAPNDVWIGSSRTLLLRGSGFQGGTATWSKQAAVAPLYSGSEPLLLSLWGTSPSDLWLGGEQSLYDYFNAHSQWHRGDDGEWTAANITNGDAKTTPPIRGIWGSSPNDVWAIGGGDNLWWGLARTRGKAYHSTSKDEDGAPIWEDVDTQSLSHLYGIWGSSADDVWAVGNDGTIRHFTKGASRWDIVESPTTEHLRGIWGSSSTNIWAVGEYGTILHYDGTTWKPSTVALPLGTKPDFRSVWGSGPNDVWVVGEGVVLHFTGPKVVKE